MILNKEQTLVLEEIEKFLKSNKKIFILKGYAGTGKTTILKKIIEKNSSYNYILLASTGVAAKVMEKKMNMKSNTIHSNIYRYSLLEEIGKDSYKLVFDTKNNSEIYEKLNIYIIDEASMISNEKIVKEEWLEFGSSKLLKDTLKKIKIERKNTKVILVGDPIQLPPVGFEESCALNKNYIEKNFNISCEEFLLTKVERQSNDNSVVKESLKIRKAINDNTQYIIEADNKNIFFVNRDEAVKIFLKNINETAFITKSNKNTMLYSNIIRKKLGYDNNYYRTGEKLLVISNNYKYDLMNGEIVFLNKSINIGDIEEKKVDINNKIYKLKFIRTSIKKEDNSIISVFMLLNFLDDEDYPDDRKVISDCLIKISMEDMKNKENFSESKYYNALQVRLGYSITCHKSQGNEFRNVILEYKNPKNSFDLKWLYTGITRTREKLYILCDDENNFIDNKKIKQKNKKNEKKQVIKKKLIFSLEGKKEQEQIIRKKLIFNN